MGRVRTFYLMRKPSLRDLLGDIAAVLYLYDFATSRGLLVYLSSALGSVNAEPLYAVFGIFLSFVLLWNTYRAILWLRERRTSRTAPPQIKSSIEESIERKVGSRRQELRNRLRDHYKQVAGVYEKWPLKLPSEVSFTNLATRESLEIGRASTLVDPDKTPRLTSKMIEEEHHGNERIVDEAVEHLKSYPELWPLWDRSLQSSKSNDNSLGDLWKDVRYALRLELSERCPELVKWYGQGALPDSYYHLPLTATYLQMFIEQDSPAEELAITQEGNYFKVIDLARSKTKEPLERLIGIIQGLSSNSDVRDKMKTILSEKARVRSNLEKLRSGLSDLSDDVSRKGHDLAGTCSTCKEWRQELMT